MRTTSRSDAAKIFSERGCFSPTEVTRVASQTQALEISFVHQHGSCLMNGRRYSGSRQGNGDDLRLNPIGFRGSGMRNESFRAPYTLSEVTLMTVTPDFFYNTGGGRNDLPSFPTKFAAY